MKERPRASGQASRTATRPSQEAACPRPPARPNPQGLILLMLLALLTVSNGCKSAPAAASGSIAWIEIPGHTFREISQATKIVLTRHGYRPLHQESEELTFERPGNAWNEITDGNWGEGVSIRVKLNISPQVNEAYMLHCRVYHIRSSGDRVFEDSRELYFGRKTYQKLLNEVKDSLVDPTEQKTSKK